MALCAGDLPLHLLAEILRLAARAGSWQASHTLAMPGLALLARVSTVSRHLRAAAEAAASVVTAVELTECAPPTARRSVPLAALLPSTSLARWGGHWTRLKLDHSGAFVRGPAFPDFVRSHCSRLESLSLSTFGPSSTSAETAHLEIIAAAATAGLQHLTCPGFIPSFGLPSGLQSLEVRCEEECQGCELEVLLVFASSLAHLCTFTLDAWSGKLWLRSASLQGVQLSQLQVFELSLSCTAYIHAADLSFLACPSRKFVLDLSCWNEGDSGAPTDWLMLLQSFCGILQPQDLCNLCFLDAEDLCQAGQALLGGLRLARFILDVPQHIVSHLPAARELTLTFEFYEGVDDAASVCWSALVQTAGSVQIAASLGAWVDEAELVVTGCLGLGSLPQSGPWSLQVLGFSTIRGLPPEGTSAPDGSYTLLNAAALAAGWT